MKESVLRQVVWGVGVFVTVFFSLNILSNFGSELIGNTLPLQTASVSESNIYLDQVSAPEIIKNIKLAFVGDIMLDRGVKKSVNKNFSGDYEKLFIKVGEQLLNYDLLFGNLEGPISNKGKDGGNLYSFRFDPKTITALKDLGFDIFSISNNHIFNWGSEAFVDTISLLSNAGINYVGGGLTGTEAYQAKIINVKGVKIAFIAFNQFKEGGITSTSDQPGIAVISEKEVVDSISQARKDADIVIVAYHFGDEYETEPNDFQIKYSRLAIQSGADLVVGTHPHVVEPLEMYRNAYIIYSLGNFVFDQSFSDETMSGGLLDVEINPSTKLIEKVALKKVLLNKTFQIDSIE